MYNKLSQTCCISSQQVNTIIWYAVADAKMHPDRGGGAVVTVGAMSWHNWHHGYYAVAYDARAFHRDRYERMLRGEVGEC